MPTFKMKDLVDILKQSGIVKFHIIHSLKDFERTTIRIHIPINADYKSLERNLYYKCPIGLSFDIRISASSYFKDQMIKRWGETAKITTCTSFNDWDTECEASDGN